MSSLVITVRTLTLVAGTTGWVFGTGGTIPAGAFRAGGHGHGTCLAGKTGRAQADWAGGGVLRFFG